MHSSTSIFRNSPIVQQHSAPIIPSRWEYVLEIFPEKAGYHLPFEFYDSKQSCQNGYFLARFTILKRAMLAGDESGKQVKCGGVAVQLCCLWERNSLMYSFVQSSLLQDALLLYNVQLLLCSRSSNFFFFFFARLPLLDALKHCKLRSLYVVW